MDGDPTPALRPGAHHDGLDSDLFWREREALARFVAAGVFQRSPNLEKILLYLCEQYFQGQSGTVKEYSIATDALGRSEEFDPKLDSIVRVEMHRLRKRLAEYYKDRGAAEPMLISIPERTYTPAFVANQSVVVAPPEAVPETEPVAIIEVPSPIPAVSTGSAWRRFSRVALPVAIIVGVLAYAGWWRRGDSAPNPSPAAAILPVSFDANGPEPLALPAAELRILAGRTGARFVDRFGQVWLPDAYFDGGAAVAIPTEVHTRGFDPNVFATMREGDFQYDIPLKPGRYEVMLLFAETMYGENNPLRGGESSRVFHIRVNGKTALENLDVIADAHDSNAATAKVFKDVEPASDGKLHLHFQAGASSKAFVNAIVIRPGLPGRMRPVRIVCRSSGFQDSKSQFWQADSFFRGGVAIVRPSGAPIPDGDMFRGERYGRFSYAIPVPPGSYTVKLYFWEYWWGPGRQGGGGVGSRVFDVFSNFKPLLRDFDILAQAGKDQILVKSFTGIAPNAEGRIALDFVPQRNFAMLNALEILDEGRAGAEDH